MKDQSWIEFKNACATYLSTLSVNSLRSYAREVGVAKPTTKKKQHLIEEILGIFSGDILPQPRATMGAPVKDSGVDVTAVKQEVERLHLQCYSNITGLSIEELKKNLENGEVDENVSRVEPFDFKKSLQQLRESGGNTVRFADPSAKEYDNDNKEIYRGQLETLNGVSLLLSLDGMDVEPKIIVPINLLRENSLYDGDIVSCYAEKSHNALVVTKILTVNDRSLEDVKRSHFEDALACYPTERINVYSETNNSVAMKYLQWLLPFGKGQRGCITSSPKAGKTNLLYDVAKAAIANNPYLSVMVLLIDQPPESVGAFRKITSSENIIYTTYEDAPETQVFAANFLLKRAKRLAECGRDVLLVVDSLNALAYAYNDTNESAGGKVFANGIESKTLQFIKKYFGAARCLEDSGSLTILGSLGVSTGNPADDLIYSELSRIANMEIRLSARLAAKRIYPAIDFSLSQVKQCEMLMTKQEQEVERVLREKFIDEDVSQKLYEILLSSNSYQDFINKI